MNMEKRRVVITGMGAIAPNGNTLEAYWDGLINGRSGIGRITQFDPSNLPTQIAGEVKDFRIEDYPVDTKEARRLPRSAQFALAVAIQAMQDSGLGEQMPNPERAGVVFGTAIGGFDLVIEGVDTIRTKGPGRVSPFILPNGIINVAAYLIAKQFQCLGPNTTLSTACATGTQTIGEGLEFIRRGAADVVIAGGMEAMVKDFTLAGFCAMRAMPVNFNDTPEKASRPFDALREGFIFSEGAGAMVLESLDHALARGARIYAEVIGHASSSDGYHVAALHPEAAGPIRAMRWALQDAGISPEMVGYINPHGTSTQANDSNETMAIKAIFGEHAYKIPISSTKSMVGHAMGASGTLEAIVCAKVIETGVIPPTINYENPDPECDLDYVPNQARRQQVNVALSNSFGLGGQNACVVLKRYTPGS